VSVLATDGRWPMADGRWPMADGRKNCHASVIWVFSCVVAPGDEDGLTAAIRLLPARSGLARAGSCDTRAHFIAAHLLLRAAYRHMGLTIRAYSREAPRGAFMVAGLAGSRRSTARVRPVLLQAEAKLRTAAYVALAGCRRLPVPPSGSANSWQSTRVRTYCQSCCSERQVFRDDRAATLPLMPR
jgi:hypothetical protein